MSLERRRGAAPQMVMPMDGINGGGLTMATAPQVQLIAMRSQCSWPSMAGHGRIPQACEATKRANGGAAATVRMPRWRVPEEGVRKAVPAATRKELRGYVRYADGGLYIIGPSIMRWMKGLLMVLYGNERQWTILVDRLHLTGPTTRNTTTVMCLGADKGRVCGIGTSAAPPLGRASSV